jgi:hypothetical protein
MIHLTSFAIGCLRAGVVKKSDLQYHCKDDGSEQNRTLISQKQMIGADSISVNHFFSAISALFSHHPRKSLYATLRNGHQS